MLENQRRTRHSSSGQMELDEQPDTKNTQYSAPKSCINKWEEEVCGYLTKKPLAWVISSVGRATDWLDIYLEVILLAYEIV